MRRIGGDIRQGSQASCYQGGPISRHYGHVVTSGRPAGERQPGCGARRPAGAALALTRVQLRTLDRGTSPAAGITLEVPPGQSVALHSPADGTAIELLDVIAGLGRPQSGQVIVDGVAVNRLSGQAMERYRGQRGLLSPRFPLLSSLSVTDNVLAALGPRRADAAARERAAELLVVSGIRHLAGSGVETLSAEQHWRVLVARALLSAPRLLLAEDPAPGLAARSAASVLDLLMDAHNRFGFTLLLATGRLAAAARCQRLVSLAEGLIRADDLAGDDDPWTRGRVDRIG
jgi:putative ABC transport system ATP-binding protein